jgi:hypothetical protein
MTALLAIVKRPGGGSTHAVATTAKKTSRARPAPRSGRGRTATLVGTWGPDEESDSNLQFTVAAKGAALTVTAVDAYDGERLPVTGVAWDGKRLRFQTVTPSTGSHMHHELEATSDAQAVYRFTVTQSWKRLG